jgi:hypothetical protein
MTSEWRNEYSQDKKKWLIALGEAENAERDAKNMFVKATSKIAQRNDGRQSELYERLIKAGDEKTLWTTVAERDPHPGWIKKKEEAVALYEATQKEWDTAHKEKTNSEELWNTARFENSQLKEKFTAWIKEMDAKGEYLCKKEAMREHAKKMD